MSKFVLDFFVSPCSCSRAKQAFFACDLLQQEEAELGGLSGGNGQLWTLGLGLLATALAATYVARLAKVMQFLPEHAISTTIKTSRFLPFLHLYNIVKYYYEPNLKFKIG